MVTAGTIPPRIVSAVSRILLLCWRDSTHPQGGGSERYLEHVAAGLAAEGHTVIYRTSRSAGAARSETTDAGVKVSRAGGRFTVYPRALAAIIAGRFGMGPLKTVRRPDVVVDTQNGVPFFSRLVTRAPVVVLVHHIHREQWPVAGWLIARIGWWIESWLAPRIHARSQYVTVSLPSAEELAELGVDPARIAVVRNGLDPLPAARPPTTTTTPTTTRSTHSPRLVVLSRLVPHKHVEDALQVAANLRSSHPGLVLDVVGSGWWTDQLAEYAAGLGLVSDGTVVFHGHVDEATKHQILAGAAIHLMPSRKEGWGLAVSEAGQHAVPTIGYHHAAGLRDSITHDETGFLVHDVVAMTAATRHLLANPDLRQQMGRAAQDKSADLSWPATAAAMGEVLRAVGEGRRCSGVVSGTGSGPVSGRSGPAPSA